MLHGTLAFLLLVLTLWLSGLMLFRALCATRSSAGVPNPFLPFIGLSLVEWLDASWHLGFSTSSAYTLVEWLDAF